MSSLSASKRSDDRDDIDDDDDSGDEENDEIPGLFPPRPFSLLYDETPELERRRGIIPCKRDVVVVVSGCMVARGR